MKLTYERRKYTIEEKRALLQKYNGMVGKTVVFLKSEDVQWADRRMEIQLLAGEVKDCKWSEFGDYPELFIDLGGNRYLEQVNAFALGWIMFENVSGIENALNRFFLGETCNFNTRLPREHKLSDFIWKRMIEFLNGYTLSDGNQFLCFNKEQGMINMVRVGVLGDEFVLTNKETIDIMQERISDTEKYSYYSVNYDEGKLTIDEPEEFYKEISAFLNNKINSFRDEAEVEELDSAHLNLDKEGEMSLGDEIISEAECLVRDMMKKILEGKLKEDIPEMAKEAIRDYIKTL